MFGSSGAEGITVVILYLLMWGLPFALAVWFIRTLSAMAAAQREIAECLRGIEGYLRSNRSGSIT